MKHKKYNMARLITFKYDSYEKGLGDGYYPQLQGELDGTSSHEFKLVWIQISRIMRDSSNTFWFPLVFDTWEEVEAFSRAEVVDDPSESSVFVRVWKQLDGDSIKGLDGSCGKDLFKLLGESGATGIVNSNAKFIYRPGGVPRELPRPPPINVEKTPTDKAKDTVRFHTAMPYVLGGSVAKYQGVTETMKYLEKAHPDIFELISREEIETIIRSTIDEENI